MRVGFCSRATRHAFAIAAATVTLCTAVQAHAAPLQWAGRSWNVTSGGMAGVAQGSPSNVSVDDSGYLHLKITKSGSTWTAAELFTTEKLGFGTYQWQVDGPIDRFDKNVVLGLHPYGPAAGIGKDGTNEIDIEYSFWGNANGVNPGDWTDYPASGTVIGEKTYKFSLNGGTLSTSRFIWSTSKIDNFLLEDLQPVGSTSGLINSWTYAPNNATVNIPQQALPLGMNLWCFDNPPSDGKDVEVVIRNFQFVPEGTNPGGSGGAAGAAAAGSAGSTSNGGSSSRGGVAGVSANGSAGGGVSGASPTGDSGNGAPTASGGAPSAGSTSASGGSASPPASAGGASSRAGAPALGGSAGAAVNGPDVDQGSGCNIGGALPRPVVTWLALLPLLALRARRRAP